MHAEHADRPQPPRTRVGMLVRDPRWILVVYSVVLAAIAFWPTPVDSGAGGFLKLIEKIVPLLTYHRLEFGANILMFVPLGVLLALILPRRRYLVLPIAVTVTAVIESTQAVALDLRTPSVLDIIANTIGACAGLLVVELVEAARRGRSQPPE
jgi:glycopeptide antibiotics resistance protein